MKCRNINQTNNSAIFFGTSYTHWPTILQFDVWSDSSSTHSIHSLTLDYENQIDTYEMNAVLDIGNNHYTDEINISILGQNEVQNNLLEISSISSDVDINKVVVSFVDDKGQIYFTQLLEIDNGETLPLQMIVPSYSIKINNYVNDSEAITTALTQKLSIFKGDLWFLRSFGLPLFEKSTKGIFDTYIAMIINKQTGVKSISKFNSKVDRHSYSLDVEINSLYGQSKVLINR